MTSLRRSLGSVPRLLCFDVFHVLGGGDKRDRTADLRAEPGQQHVILYFRRGTLNNFSFHDKCYLIAYSHPCLTPQMELQCGSYRENESQDEVSQDPVEKYLKKFAHFMRFNCRICQRG